MCLLLGILWESRSCIVWNMEEMGTMVESLKLPGWAGALAFGAMEEVRTMVESLNSPMADDDGC